MTSKEKFNEKIFEVFKTLMPKDSLILKNDAGIVKKIPLKPKMKCPACGKLAVCTTYSEVSSVGEA